jgi:hypothetical protein
MKEFSQSVCEKIGYYVYVLKDPRDSKIFYIGKGVGNRVFRHVFGVLDNSNETDKLNLIREIINDDLEVQHYILRHSLTSEQALEIESACIDLLGLQNLTNSVKGHNSWERGLKTVNEVIQYYDAKIVTISEPAIIITINKYYKRFMSEEDLYNITRISWRLANRRIKTIKYGIASYRGIVREVYEIEGWFKTEDGKRWCFTGKIAEENIRNKYLNQSLENYIKKGSQNPIKYTF